MFDRYRVTIFLTALSVLWRVSGYLLRRSFIRKLTVLEDLKAAGKPRPDGQSIKGTAVVCGGRWARLPFERRTQPSDELLRSIAGLWAARICADHFEDVLVVEAESWVGTEEGRTPLYDENGVIREGDKVQVRARVHRPNFTGSGGGVISRLRRSEKGSGPKHPVRTTFPSGNALLRTLFSTFH